MPLNHPHVRICIHMYTYNVQANVNCCCCRRRYTCLEVAGGVELLAGGAPEGGEARHHVGNVPIVSVIRLVVVVMMIMMKMVVEGVCLLVW